MRHLGWLAGASVIVLAVTLVAALLVDQRKREDDLARQARLTCRYVTFTRATQRGVVNYLDEVNHKLALLSFRPELRAFARSQSATLDALRRRTEPPACKQ